MLNKKNTVSHTMELPRQIVVGEKIAKNTEIETIESGVIVVKTKNSVWRQELQMQKPDIVDRLNKVLTKKVIKDIRFV